MKTWAHRNPALARILLRLGMRMAVAIGIVIVLMPIAERQGWSPNIAAIGAVVVGLIVGAKLAERVAILWGLPEETFPGTKPTEKNDG
jgi:uncharacterized YccA/Bax inhibitor family protein